MYGAPTETVRAKAGSRQSGSAGRGPIIHTHWSFYKSGQVIRQCRAIKSVRKQANEMPGPETRALFGGSKAPEEFYH
jgi:hypothetical protein